ncbi:MAG: cell division topological specificity factor MinE [Anaerolineae bacterium]|nr:cell division topological specificity factor MinE [Anaerolineae bacterium]
MPFFDSFFKSRSTSSRQQAKERLQLVLVHDRTGISPKLMQTLKDEIITVISKHIAIDREGVDITFTQTRHQSRLQADIPLQKRSRQRATE